MLDVRRLLMLRAVAQRGSLAAAARDLGYTQPAVSHHIHRLETEAGTRLIARDGRGVTLTQAGRLLASRADAIAAELAAAEAQLASLARSDAGHVRLAALPTSNACLVPDAIADLAARGLKIRLSLMEARPDEALALLERADCDLAVTFDHPTMPLNSGNLVTVPLLDDPVLVILPAAHPLAGAAEVDLARLAAEPWITSKHCRQWTLHVCALAGFTPSIALSTDDYQAAARLVAAGFGVCLTSSCVREATDHLDLALVPVAGIAHRQILAALPGRPRPTAAVSAVVAALQNAARNISPVNQLSRSDAPG